LVGVPVSDDEIKRITAVVTPLKQDQTPTLNEQNIDSRDASENWSIRFSVGAFSAGKVALAIAFCFWWSFGLWLYSGIPPLWDEKEYLKLGRFIASASWKEYVADITGTLVRPPLYPMFLGLSSLVLPGIQNPSTSRFIGSLIQSASYIGTTIFLIRSAKLYGQRMQLAIAIGLLGLPFPIFTQSELLSESLTLSIFIALSAVIIRNSRTDFASSTASSHTLILTLIILMAITRTVHIPVAIVSILIYMARACWFLGNPETRRRALKVVIAGAAVVAVTLGVEGALLFEHNKVVPNDPRLLGVGALQLEWSLSAVKYTTLALPCAGVSPGARYTNPLYSPAPRSPVEIATWYVAGPLTGLLHLFSAINYDFPTTYVTTLNTFVIYLFNIISLICVTYGFLTIARHRGGLWRTFATFKSLIALVPVWVLMLWGQTAFVLVETRFGIIPWTALAVASVYGVLEWLETPLLSVRAHTKALIGFAFAVAGGLALSRWLVLQSPQIADAFAKGC